MRRGTPSGAFHYYKGVRSVLSNQEKLLEFKRSIERELEAQISQIDQDIEQYRQSQTAAIEDAVYSDCYRLIQAQTAKIKLEFTTERSHRLGELRRNLLLKRDEYVGLLFEDVRRNLMEFTSGKAYPDYLRRKLLAAVEEYHPASPVLLVRKEDQKYEPFFREILPGCSVREDPGITIGGFIIEGAGLPYVIDESLDHTLAEQKEWFYSNSGLRVTQI